MVEKKNLERLLQILPVLLETKGNEWFKEEISKLVTNNTIHAYSESSKEYLIINPGVLLIDYREILDEKVRTQLTVDCYEMARHRLGRVNHKPDFDEFCRYAHMQIEELINYFFFKNFIDHENVKIFIESYCTLMDKPKVNKKYIKANDTSTSITHIDYSIKSNALISYLGIRNSFNINMINQVRNKVAHRSSLSETDDNSELIKYMNEQKIDPNIKKPFLIHIIEFRRKQDWNIIITSIEEIKEAILNKLSSSI